MSAVLLAGATGLVGGHTLSHVLASPKFDRVVALSRRPLATTDPRLETRLVDFAHLDDTPAAPAQAALCALGTTIRKAGSQQAFRAVDHDAVLAFARFAERSGVRTLAVVSSVGADPAARNFYLRVKGETERDVAALGIATVVFLRPGLLLGERADRRLGEAIAQRALPVLAPLLAGPLRRYRAIDGTAAARALVAAAALAEPGRVIWHNDEILAHAPA